MKSMPLSFGSRVLTLAQVRTMIELYRNGWNTQQLATHFGVSRQAIWKLLKRRGVPTRPRHVARFDEHGKFKPASSDSISRRERDEQGCIVVLEDLKTRDWHTMHVRGKRIDALREVAAWCDRMPGDWRLLSYSTPVTILGDLQGNRTDVAERTRQSATRSGNGNTQLVNATPEGRALGKIGRRDLLHPSLDR